METDDHEVQRSNPGTPYKMDHLFVVKIVLSIDKTADELKIGREWPIFMDNKNDLPVWHFLS